MSDCLKTYFIFCKKNRACATVDIYTNSFRQREREREREREMNLPLVSCFIFNYDHIVQHTQPAFREFTNGSIELNYIISSVV